MQSYVFSASLRLTENSLGLQDFKNLADLNARESIIYKSNFGVFSVLGQPLRSIHYFAQNASVT